MSLYVLNEYGQEFHNIFTTVTGTIITIGSISFLYRLVLSVWCQEKATAQAEKR